MDLCLSLFKHGKNSAWYRLRSECLATCSLCVCVCMQLMPMVVVVVGFIMPMDMLRQQRND